MPPLLCYVTDRRALAKPSRLADQMASAIAAGIDWVQIREKDLPARELLALARAALKAAASGPRRGAQIMINDRLDVALACGADGVHLGESSLPVAAVNAWRREPALQDDSSSKVWPREFLVGASCHSVEAARAAARDGADYIIFGPVFATPSKEQFGAPQGINRLAEASRAVKIPVLAIGGISEENARECFAAGAAGIAAIRMFSGERELAGLVARLRAAT